MVCVGGEGYIWGDDGVKWWDVDGWGLCGKKTNLTTVWRNSFQFLLLFFVLFPPETKIVVKKKKVYFFSFLFVHLFSDCNTHLVVLMIHRIAAQRFHHHDNTLFVATSKCPSLTYVQCDIITQVGNPTQKLSLLWNYIGLKSTHKQPHHMFSVSKHRRSLGGIRLLLELWVWLVNVTVC